MCMYCNVLEQFPIIRQSDLWIVFWLFTIYKQCSHNIFMYVSFQMCLISSLGQIPQDRIVGLKSMKFLKEICQDIKHIEVMP